MIDLRNKKLLEVIKEYNTFRYIRKELLKGNSIGVVIVGATRKGKTMSGLKIGELFDPNLSLEYNYYTDLTEMISNIWNRDMRRQVIIYDEAGKDLDIRKWNSEFNSVFSILMQTQAYRNNLYIVIFPHQKMISSSHYFLLDIIIEKISRQIGIAYKVHKRYIDFNHSKPFYFIKLDSIAFKLPSKRLMIQFKNKEDIEKKKIMESLFNRLYEKGFVNIEPENSSDNNKNLLDDLKKLTQNI